jgi:signal transduction histidine kinase
MLLLPIVQAFEFKKRSLLSAGLGLYLSKHIAKLLGGDLWFEPGNGELWFELRLPRQI